MKNIEYCNDCTFYDKKNEKSYTKFLNYGNGKRDYVYITEAFCLKHNFLTVPEHYSCDEMNDEYITEQIQLEMEFENYYAEENYNE